MTPEPNLTWAAPPVEQLADVLAGTTRLLFEQTTVAVGLAVRAAHEVELRRAEDVAGAGG